MYIQEQWINKTEGYRCGETDVYEAFTDNVLQLFRLCQREHGRCVSHVYVGENPPIKIGWVFEKLRKYEDTQELYVSETWVTLHREKPERTIEYQYLELKG